MGSTVVDVGKAISKDIESFLERRKSISPLLQTPQEHEIIGESSMEKNNLPAEADESKKQ